MVYGLLLPIRNQCRFTSSSRRSSLEPRTLSAPSFRSYVVSGPGVDLVWFRLASLTPDSVDKFGCPIPMQWPISWRTVDSKSNSPFGTLLLAPEYRFGPVGACAFQIAMAFWTGASMLAAFGEPGSM